MKLFGYFRSSAAYRVRIALNLKQLTYEAVPVHLLRQGGEQFSPTYQSINSQSLVPSLVDDLSVLTQSLAIIEYLEERYPNHRLLPEDIIIRAQVRAFALSIACDIHPLNNLRVQKYLSHDCHMDEYQSRSWVQHWINLGFIALEKELQSNDGGYQYCFGDEVGIADVFLVPQIYNALRFNLDLQLYPKLVSIYDRCQLLPEFQAAAPENQLDAE